MVRVQLTNLDFCNNKITNQYEKNNQMLERFG